jgi:hypothetical protein
VKRRWTDLPDGSTGEKAVKSATVGKMGFTVEEYPDEKEEKIRNFLKRLQ